MSAMVNVNGRILDQEHAVISVFDHGFLYGEGVYEVLRTYDGVPFLFDRHMRRLRASASMLRLEVPIGDAEIERRFLETIAAAGLGADGNEAYIRILVTRGVGDITYDPAACPVSSIVIIAKPHVDAPAAAYADGVMVSLVGILRNHPGSVNPIIKSNNLLNNALGNQEALRKGAFEAIMRNYRGEIAECSQSNIFIVKDGVAVTPPVDAGLLVGITRDFLFEVAREVGVPMRDGVVLDADLLGADEAFLTSTTRELVPIVRVDDHVIGSGRPGALTRKLLDAFRVRARSLVSLRT
ncbi:MAG TPA: aminotransferase class IV [Vicinamibacterales bacterium]|nr:aminotransferase class IV [Vicinamibacterales bacterium]